jgi:hypothetical protein
MPVINDLGAQLRQLTEIVIQGQARTDARFERLEMDIHGLKMDVTGLKTDVAVLKTDVAVLKTDVGGLKADVAQLKTEMVDTRQQLARLEVSTDRRFNRVDASLEELRGRMR